MSDAWVTPFLASLRATGVVARACVAASVSSAQVYTRRKEDADFAAAWDNALEDSYDALEAEARRRALEGVDEPVIYQGQPTPLWERDADGQVVLEEYVAQTRADGSQVMGSRPKQLVVDGRPQFLTVNKKSDALLQFLLKGYRKRFGTETTELTGKDGAPLQVDATQRAARVAALLEMARLRKSGANVDDLA
jgi:hypothetical protein